MRAKVKTIRTYPGSGAMRYRVRHRATKTTRRVWTEWTNQPSGKDWHEGWMVYEAFADPSGVVRLRSHDGWLSRVGADRLVLDLRDLIEAAEWWNGSRRRRRSTTRRSRE